jgi:RNA-directed DNA polymerase
MSRSAPFKDLRNLLDVAKFLACSRERLRYLLYRLPPSERYRSFSIRKKGGGERVIRAPTPEILELQRRLHQVLIETTEPKHSTHGFCLGRSIVTNSRVHVGATILLNLDLEDFFPSIHIGRVRGRFMARPFHCNKAVATILAQLCCNDGRLPQGAPTSPIISNLICGGLDVELQRFSVERQCRYTRYADDLSFSTKRNKFPDDMVASTSAPFVVGERLEQIIQGHGFEVNREKVRVQTRSQRQVVTGLKVNRFPNPSRKLFSQVRAMIHARRKFGLEKAEMEFRRRTALVHRSPLRGPPSFLWSLRGKIQFIGMVRGFSSPKFTNLARELRDLEPEIVKHWDIRDRRERITDALWVLESEEASIQGTGFFLEGVGLITCEHVVFPDTKAFRATAPETQYPVRLRAADKTVDLAICDVDVKNPRTLVKGSGRRAKQGDEILLAGFPNFRYGATPHIAPGVIVSSYVRSIIERFVIDAPIVKGNSGGPVVNADGYVIGVAVTGTDRFDDLADTADFAAIPITALSYITTELDQNVSASPAD